MKTYTVPQQIRRIAQKAIDYNMSLPISKRAAFVKDGERKSGMGMRTARRLVSGKVDESQLRLMRAWFARHGASPKEAEARKDKTSKARIAWDLWGSSVGRRWVNYTLKQIEKD